MKSINKLVYLPIEFSSRELDSKASLAAHLANNGFSVVIGQQWELYKQLTNLPKGIFLFKSHNKIHLSAMKIAKQYGHLNIAMEEEVMAICDEQSMKKASFKDIYKYIDFIFCHGEFEKSFHLNESCDKSKLIVTGNPRIDLLKDKYRVIYQEKIRSIHNKYGNYVLVNTNFGIKNSIWKNLQDVINIHIRSGAINVNDPISIKDFNVYLEWEDNCFKEIDRLVKKLSSDTNLNIIVRPHPGEFIQKAEEQFKGLKNVFVVRDGSHVPWTLGSEMLIHTSCTTGLEASVANKFAISVNPNNIWYSDQILSNQINLNIKTYQETFSRITDYIKNKIQPKSKKLSSVKFYVENIDQSNAIKNISNFIGTLNLNKKIDDLHLINSSQMEGIIKEKCNFHIDEVKATIEKISTLDNLLNNSNFHIKPVADNLFLIN